jgi:hypothetical protein
VAVLDSVDDEPVQALVTPAEGELQDQVQLGDGGVLGDQQPTPDQRADPGQDHPKLVHSSRRTTHGPGHEHLEEIARRAVRSRSATRAVANGLVNARSRSASG